MHIQEFSVQQLIKLFADLQEELERRNVVRSANIVGDYTEHLVAQAFSLDLMPSSTRGYDGINAKGVRYQIKGRKLTQRNPSREMSAIRGLEQHHFDWLVGVLFNRDFSVFKACLIPYASVVKLADYKKTGDKHILILRDAVWHTEGVVDMTQQLLMIQNSEAV